MPKVTLGTLGFDMVFTARIPPAAQTVLQSKSEDEVAAFGLTPAWGHVPTLLVADLRRAGIELPQHWSPTNEIYPVIHNIAFYLVPHIPGGMAMSLSMKGVNLRTGRAEEEGLTDKPCQSYWTTKTYTPWIDGYRPSHAEAVRQFLPLRGDEMVADVSDHVGISKDHPWKDGISAGFYLPEDLSKLSSGPAYRSHSALESFTSKGVRTRGATLGARLPEAVGMGAGALMRQQHPDVPGVKAADYLPNHLLRITARIVWLDQWNIWARETGERLVPASRLRELEQRQEQYEAHLWARIGGVPVQTDVDNFPVIG